MESQFKQFFFFVLAGDSSRLKLASEMEKPQNNVPDGILSDKKTPETNVATNLVIDALCQFRTGSWSIIFDIAKIALLKYYIILFHCFLKSMCLDKTCLDRQYHENDGTSIKKPDELEKEMGEPPGPIDKDLLNRIQGSMIGMALGDALGAHVEFRPYQYMVANPVTDLGSGGTWGLLKGQVWLLHFQVTLTIVPMIS
jgi:hypothetical protein